MRWRTVGPAYVGGVFVLATVGFVADSAPAILVAAALSLPASIVALPGYYAAYGLLALVPGANPSTSSGSASCSPDGVCTSSSVGDPAGWFVVATGVLGVLALTCAALLNLLAVRMLLARRQLSRRV